MTSVPADPPPDGPTPSSGSTPRGAAGLSGGPGQSGDAGTRSAERPPPPGPLAVEAALLVDALRGLAGTESGGRLWEAVADVAGGVGAAAGGLGVGGAGAGGGRAGGGRAGGGGADAGAPADAGVPAGPAGAAGGAVCAGHGRPCTSCPLCRLLAMFAGDRPEVVRHLLTAAESLAAAFRVALEAYSGSAYSGGARPGTAHARTARAGDARDETAAPASPGAGRTTHQNPRPGAAAGTRSAPAPRPRVQRIDVT